MPEVNAAIRATIHVIVRQMRWKTLLRAAVPAAAIALWIACTQAPQQPAQLALQKLADDLYVIALAKGVGGGNVAVYLTDEGVVLIDDMFDRDYESIIGLVKSISDKP